MGYDGCRLHPGPATDGRIGGRRDAATASSSRPGARARAGVRPVVLRIHRERVRPRGTFTRAHGARGLIRPPYMDNDDDARATYVHYWSLEYVSAGRGSTTTVDSCIYPSSIIISPPASFLAVVHARVLIGWGSTGRLAGGGSESGRAAHAFEPRRSNCWRSSRHDSNGGLGGPAVPGNLHSSSWAS